LGLFLFPFF